MRKVNVWLKQTVSINVELEVPELTSDEEIEQRVFSEFNGLRSYCGNGGTDKLIGVKDDNISVEVCDDLELDEIRED